MLISNSAVGCWTITRRAAKLKPPAVKQKSFELEREVLRFFKAGRKAARLVYEGRSWTKCSTRRFVVAFRRFLVPLWRFVMSYRRFVVSTCRFVVSAHRCSWSIRRLVSFVVSPFRRFVMSFRRFVMSFRRFDSCTQRDYNWTYIT